jgi:hypothetical protein
MRISITRKQLAATLTCAFLDDIGEGLNGSDGDRDVRKAGHPFAELLDHCPARTNALSHTQEAARAHLRSLCSRFSPSAQSQRRPLSFPWRLPSTYRLTARSMQRHFTVASEIAVGTLEHREWSGLALRRCVTVCNCLLYAFCCHCVRGYRTFSLAICPAIVAHADASCSHAPRHDA